MDDLPNSTSRGSRNPTSADSDADAGHRPLEEPARPARRPVIEPSPVLEEVPSLPIAQIETAARGEPIITVKRPPLPRSHPQRSAAESPDNTAKILRQATAQRLAERTKRLKPHAGKNDSLVSHHARGLAGLGCAPRVVFHDDPNSPQSDEYRTIRSRILSRHDQRRIQSHVITSAGAREGRSVTVVNLAVAFTELFNDRILLIEGDLHRPSFHLIFGKWFAPGLLHLLRGGIDHLDRVIYPTAYINLDVIPAGHADPQQAEKLISDPMMEQVLESAKSRYDHIFIDTPPLKDAPDGCRLGAMGDETLLVLRRGKTRVRHARRARQWLEKVGCNVGGTILAHQ